MATIDLGRNALLGMLPPAVVERVDGGATLHNVLPGDALIEPGDAVDAVYFPLDIVVAIEQPIVDHVEAGAAPGVALTGSEGAVGIEPFFGAELAAGRARVLIGGQVLRLDAALLHQEFARGGALQRTVLRWADALLAQVAATSACERTHPVEQRLVRWLLVCDDRAPLRDLGLTQAALAQLLGVRRASVTAAASGLRDAGLIDYHRGTVTIVDRGGIEARACRCWRDIQARYRSYLNPD